MQGDDCKTCWHYRPPGEGWTFPGDGLHDKEVCMLLWLSRGCDPVPAERTCKCHETRAEQAARLRAEAEAAKQRQAARPRCTECGKVL